MYEPFDAPIQGASIKCALTIQSTIPDLVGLLSQVIYQIKAEISTQKCVDF